MNVLEFVLLLWCSLTLDFVGWKRDGEVRKDGFMLLRTAFWLIWKVPFRGIVVENHRRQLQYAHRSGSFSINEALRIIGY
jgi:hypothetical protein